MKKACKLCRMIVEGDKCPVCKDSKLTDSWRGKIFISDPEKSEIAKILGIKVKGDYALKI